MKTIGKKILIIRFINIGYIGFLVSPLYFYITKYLCPNYLMWFIGIWFWLVGTYLYLENLRYVEKNDK